MHYPKDLSINFPFANFCLVTNNGNVIGIYDETVRLIAAAYSLSESWLACIYIIPLFEIYNPFETPLLIIVQFKDKRLPGPWPLSLWTIIEFATTSILPTLLTRCLSFSDGIIQIFLSCISNINQHCYVQSQFVSRYVYFKWIQITESSKKLGKNSILTLTFFFPWFLFVESTGTGDKVANYFGQLAAANHVKKLVERYLTLAPVFIGGPGKYL